IDVANAVMQRVEPLRNTESEYERGPRLVQLLARTGRPEAVPFLISYVVRTATRPDTDATGTDAVMLRALRSLTGDDPAKVQEGADLSSKLKDVFGDILSSAEISAGSSQQIVSSVNQQVSAFEQILITLKQISSGIDEFVATTRSTSGAAESLKDMGEELKTSLSRYKISE
ncbi:MAG TPA: hypothetical protein PLE73_05330, partial [Spirochaetota bacterium]|nr:hypothetical protein [Spirochaetota bacterium]